MQDFNNNQLKASDVKIFDESHFIFDMENGRVLDFSGKTRVTYNEVSSGRENSRSTYQWCS